MKQKPAGRPSSAVQIIRDIRHMTRKQYSAEEKNRIVLDGLRGCIMAFMRPILKISRISPKYGTMITT